MKLFNVHYCPDMANKKRFIRGKFRNTSDEEARKLTEGFMTEERIMTAPVVVCPFCMERNPASFYEYRKEKYEAVNEAGGSLKPEFSADIHNMKRASEPAETYFNRGLIEEEKEVPAPHFWQKKYQWYVRSIVCTTCGSSYESLPYRKNHYIALK